MTKIKNLLIVLAAMVIAIPLFREPFYTNNHYLTYVGVLIGIAIFVIFKKTTIHKGE